MSGCKACQQPLVLELDPEDFDEASSSAVGGAPTTVPDDLELPCGCHFHWYVRFYMSIVAVLPILIDFCFSSLRVSLASAHLRISKSCVCSSSLHLHAKHVTNNAQAMSP